MNVKVLHICSAYPKNKLYSNLITSLDEYGVISTVFSAVRDDSDLKSIYKENNRVYIAEILKLYHRFFFDTKIKKVFTHIQNLKILEDVDLVHAHFLFSDGAVANQIKHMFGIPYIVAVRNTDVNAFMKYRKDLYWRMLNIVKDAKKIIFLNYPYFNKFVAAMPNSMKNLVLEKSLVIPNGIDDIYFKSERVITSSQAYRALYVGDFSKNKNIGSTIEAISRLRRLKLDVDLTLIGDGGNWKKKFDELYLHSNHYKWIKYLGRINDRELLKWHYGQCDLFIMPSHNETFGLSYIEAISQGAKAICSTGQGIDGYFGSNIVRTVDPKNIASIGNAIQALSATPPVHLADADLERFRWENIAKKYTDIYQAV